MRGRDVAGYAIIEKNVEVKKNMKKMMSLGLIALMLLSVQVSAVSWNAYQPKQGRASVLSGCSDFPCTFGDLIVPVSGFVNPRACIDHYREVNKRDLAMLNVPVRSWDEFVRLQDQRARVDKHYNAQKRACRQQENNPLRYELQPS